ncbi:MAG TPA: PadR family transcriptional regulator [Gaiella sp.]|jgi:DNA-binding PadR family transcriptional regulator|nr:PadR family transcriptional regulator [Gaiella sp.]
MSTRQLTTTSYAILGLLAIRPWSTYDLAKQLRRSLHFYWPRAESNLYAEPKRLVEAGLAEAHDEWNGDRKRTMYSITESGRAALRDWLATAPASQRLEAEAYIRIMFGNSGTKDDLLRAIERIEHDAEAQVDHFRRLGGEYARGEGLFPERIHVNALIATLGIEQGLATARWARWAKAEVERWEETVVPDVDWAVRALNEAFDSAASDGS